MSLREVERREPRRKTSCAGREVLGTEEREIELKLVSSVSQLVFRRIDKKSVVICFCSRSSAPLHALAGSARLREPWGWLTGITSCAVLPFAPNGSSGQNLNLKRTATRRPDAARQTAPRRRRAATASLQRVRYHRGAADARPRPRSHGIDTNLDRLRARGREEALLVSTES